MSLENDIVEEMREKLSGKSTERVLRFKKVQRVKTVKRDQRRMLSSLLILYSLSFIPYFKHIVFQE